MHGEFDAIWQFEIQGRKFEEIENPLKLGVLESQKCYFILFYKNGRVAIVMWRGKDQNLLDFPESMKVFRQTKFRLVKNGLRAKGVRSQSTVHDVSEFMKHKEAKNFTGGEISLEAAGKSESLFGMADLNSIGLDLADHKRKSALEDT